MNYNPSEHAFECEARHKQWEAEMQEYLKRWPTHCRTCMGHGEGEYENGEVDFCPACVGDDRCPRCSEELNLFAPVSGPCANCGWELGEMMGGPVEPECICEEL